MTISSVDLQDPDSVWLDEGGRSLGFFCKKKPVRVDAALLRELKETSVRLEGKDMRICLHESPDAAFHDMIILVRRGNYYRPHKHPSKGESYHIIEGSLGVAIFDEDGNVEDACVLAPNHSLIYRTGENMYHAVIPVSDLVIYHESVAGPFIREHNSVFPHWAPDGSKDEESSVYVKHLTHLIEITAMEK